jgi:hypothetical protein
MSSHRKRTAKFDAVQSMVEPRWNVRVTLQHGERILIGEFMTEVTALEWIAEKSAAWLKKYRGGRSV